MSTEPDPDAALDATMSAPGVTPRRSGPAVRAAATPGAVAEAGPATGEPPRGLEPGDTLGRYVLGARIGSGGMGQVFRAKDPDLGREVAIKVLHVEPGGGGSSLERRLLREAQAMATLSHENLAGVFDIGTSGGRVFVAMELVDGGSLRALIADPKRSWRDKLAAVIAAGRGLAAAHSAGVIHRDFKPDNVLVARSGRVKVVDFGLARAEPEPGAVGDAIAEAADARGLPPDLSANLTQTGALLGTPAYMAPEQHAGEVVDARADQFAFAVTAWEAVHGQRPFRSDAYASLVAAVRAHEIVAPARSDVPAALDAVLRRALSPEPHRRFTSMDALLAAIEDAVRPRRARAWIAAAAVAAVATGGVTLYVTEHGRGHGAATASRPAMAMKTAAPAAPAPPPTPPTTPTTAPPTATPMAPPPPPTTTATEERTTGTPALVERTRSKATGTRLSVQALDLSDLAAAAKNGGRDAGPIMLTRMAQANVVRAHRKDAIACFDGERVAHGGLVLLEVDLDAAGKVTADRVDEDTVGGRVGDCVAAAARTWRFPASADGKATTIRLPLEFHPAGEDRGEGADDAGDSDADGDDDSGGMHFQLPPVPGLPHGLDVPLPVPDVRIPDVRGPDTHDLRGPDLRTPDTRVPPTPPPPPRAP
ncbi:MAG TPA: protein kinase [Kofleriaceae bacterium]|nr:protein kinase [Kofleriaceae bacterium]